ncbi:MAG TPA: sulfite exporter TauE/SafE family protein [Xanthobacteraceae bacterium]
MSFNAVFADISVLQLALVAAMAMVASIVGGLAGYGTGALMPLVLVPILGAEPVVPIISISALFTNSSRVLAFRKHVDLRRVVIVLVAAIPTCMLGAYGYTRLTDRGALIVIGTMLALSVPLRRLLARRSVLLGPAGLAAGAAGFGVLAGGTTGAGIVLLSILMAAGLEGAAVIATDAAVSIVIGVVKVLVFGVTGVITAQVIAFALLIGLLALPGAFVAKAIVQRMPVRLHAGILDAVVLLAGASMVVGAARG